MQDDANTDLESQYNSFIFGKIAIIAGLVIVVLISFGVSLAVNEVDVGFFDSYKYIIKHLMGAKYTFGTDDWNNDYVLWEYYTPRIIMGIVAGAALAVCGVVMQGIMNNPLADPYTIGVSDGACLGAVAAIVMGFTLSSVSSSMGVVVNAFIVGLVPALIIIILSRVMVLSPATSILIGVALSYIFSGFETAIMVTTDADTLKSAYLWQIGSLTNIVWSDCYLPTALTIMTAVIMIMFSRDLNLLSLGDDSAKTLGLNVQQFKTVCMVVLSICIAAIVSFCGIIGFVGLVVPHLLRMVMGADNRYLIPASMAAGAAFIVIADLLSRTLIAPDELRVGLIASIIGAPFFLYMILRKKSYGSVY